MNPQNGCEGLQLLTPEPVENRPGLSSLAYRVGTHATFFETMLARLSQPVSGDSAHRPLDRLTVRRPSDPAIALLDAWAMILDVLTFYQERYFNEGFLKTAVDLRSVHELSHLLGYEPRPGVSASVFLAMELDEPILVAAARGPRAFHDAGELASTVLIPQGTQAKSTPIPGSDQTPQSFETMRDLSARPAWNLLRPETRRPQDLRLAVAATVPRLVLNGTGLRVAVNDWIAIDNRGHAAGPRLRRVSDVEEDPDRQVTIVSFDVVEQSVSAVRRELVTEFERIQFAIQNGQLVFSAPVRKNLVAAIQEIRTDIPEGKGFNLVNYDAEVVAKLQALHPESEQLKPVQELFDLEDCLRNDVVAKLKTRKQNKFVEIRNQALELRQRLATAAELTDTVVISSEDQSFSLKTEPLSEVFSLSVNPANVYLEFPAVDNIQVVTDQGRAYARGPVTYASQLRAELERLRFKILSVADNPSYHCLVFVRNTERRGLDIVEAARQSFSVASSTGNLAKLFEGLEIAKFKTEDDETVDRQVSWTLSIDVSQDSEMRGLPEVTNALKEHLKSRLQPLGGELTGESTFPELRGQLANHEIPLEVGKVQRRFQVQLSIRDNQDGSTTKGDELAFSQVEFFTPELIIPLVPRLTKFTLKTALRFGTSESDLVEASEDSRYPIRTAGRHFIRLTLNDGQIQVASSGQILDIPESFISFEVAFPGVLAKVQKKGTATLTFTPAADLPPVQVSGENQSDLVKELRSIAFSKPFADKIGIQLRITQEGDAIERNLQLSRFAIYSLQSFPNEIQVATDIRSKFRLEKCEPDDCSVIVESSSGGASGRLLTSGSEIEAQGANLQEIRQWLGTHRIRQTDFGTFTFQLSTEILGDNRQTGGEPVQVKAARSWMPTLIPLSKLFNEIDADSSFQERYLLRLRITGDAAVSPLGESDKPPANRFQLLSLEQDPPIVQVFADAVAKEYQFPGALNVVSVRDKLRSLAFEPLTQGRYCLELRLIAESMEDDAEERVFAAASQNFVVGDADATWQIKGVSGLSMATQDTGLFQFLEIDGPRATDNYTLKMTVLGHQTMSYSIAPLSGTIDAINHRLDSLRLEIDDQGRKSHAFYVRIQLFESAMDGENENKNALAAIVLPLWIDTGVAPYRSVRELRTAIPRLWQLGQPASQIVNSLKGFRAVVGTIGNLTNDGNQCIAQIRSVIKNLETLSPQGAMAQTIRTELIEDLKSLWTKPIVSTDVRPDNDPEERAELFRREILPIIEQAVAALNSAPDWAANSSAPEVEFQSALDRIRVQRFYKSGLVAALSDGHRRMLGNILKRRQTFINRVISIVRDELTENSDDRDNVLAQLQELADCLNKAANSDPVLPVSGASQRLSFSDLVDYVRFALLGEDRFPVGIPRDCLGENPRAQIAGAIARNPRSRAEIVQLIDEVTASQGVVVPQEGADYLEDLASFFRNEAADDGGGISLAQFKRLLAGRSGQIFEPIQAIAAEEMVGFENLLTGFRNTHVAQPRVFVFRSQARLFGWQARQAIFDQLTTAVCAGTDDVCSDLEEDLKPLRDFLREPKNRVLFGGDFRPMDSREPEGESGRKLYLDGTFRGVEQGGLIAIRQRKAADSSRANDRGNASPADSAEPMGADGRPAGDAEEPSATNAMADNEQDDNGKESGFEPYYVQSAQTRPRTAYGLSGECTEIDLEGEQGWWDPAPDANGFDVIRSTRVLCESELMELAEETFEEALSAGQTEITLDTLTIGLGINRPLIIDGVPTLQTGDGIRVREFVRVQAIRHDYNRELYGDSYRTTLVLDRPLKWSYRRETVKIYANVVEATHGESREEILGGGDGNASFAAYALKNSPISQVPAATPSGTEQVLAVNVNNVEWDRVDALNDQGPEAEVYLVRIDADGQTQVVFGDGEHGSRAPTGQDNLRAKCRVGLGEAGNVEAGQIDQLIGGPLGVKGVINPLPAQGGADPDGVKHIRRRAPLAVRGADRLISVGDYEDFALGFGGITKATALRFAGTIHLTVAGTKPPPLPPDGALLRNLRKALKDLGQTRQPVQVHPHRLVRLFVGARISLVSGWEWEDVQTKLRERLLRMFSFDRADFHGDALSSEAVEILQDTPGVLYVDLDYFDKQSSESPAQTNTRNRESYATDGQRYEFHTRVRAEPFETQTSTSSAPRGAELLYLSPEIADTVVLELIP